MSCFSNLIQRSWAFSMTSLVSLPQTLLDAILGSDMSPSVIKLWLSGDRLLQYKLSTGVTKMKLMDHVALTTSRFPKMIESLRALRELHISRLNSAMPYYRDLGKHVQHLPSTLKKLRLAVKNSISVISSLPPSNAREIASIAPNTKEDLLQASIVWTFASAFPHLETLELDSDNPFDAGDFALLPPSLTKLTISSVPSDANEHYSSQIPRQLLQFKVESDASLATSFWAHLPPHLTNLSIDNRSNEPLPAEILSQLPQSLTTLNGLPPGPYLPSMLPSSLTRFNTDMLSKFEYASPTEIGDFGRHFSNLMWLKTTRPIDPSFLLALPSTVQTIDADTVVSNDTQTWRWPASLTTLRVETTPGPFSPSCLASTSLTALKLPSGFVFDLNMVKILPRTLLYLRAYDGIPRTQNIEFPPHLTSLILEASTFPFVNWIELSTSNMAYQLGSNLSAQDRAGLNGQRVSSCFPYHALPPSLTNLTLESLLPASQLKFLPRRLKTLNVDDIFEDADFDPADTVEMDAMQSIFEVGQQEEIRESFDWTQLKRSTIGALLPRTLNSISIWADAMSDRTDWSLIPPQLTEISILPAAGINGAWLPKMPFKHVTSLFIRLQQLTDDHFIGFPKRLDASKVYIVDRSDLTLDCLLHISPLFLCPSKPSKFLTQSSNLLTKLYEHNDDEDPSLFLKLCRPDKDTLNTIPDTA